ncbi:hypothetical protein C8R46DRAFT_1135345 [Mycena filopes]|nr:hypothetical protein C8R46DRAFT_1135345 [Mycena filopes]
MLDQLDADVLQQILYLTDVHTILSVSGVCKTLHAISFTKHLWLLVVQDLSRRGLVGPGTFWETLSRDELVEEVRCTVDSPRTWNRGHECGSSGEFLHGGKYILFSLGGFRGLECWEVLSSRRIWAWRSSTHVVRESKFDFSRGRSNVLVLLLCGAPPAGMQERIILLNVNLATGESSEIFGLDLPAIQLRVPVSLPRVPQISEHVLACILCLSSEWKVLLVDWAAHKFMLIALGPRPQGATPFVLLPGYIILPVPRSYMRAPDTIRIYSLISLQHLWRPFASLVVTTGVCWRSRAIM